MKENKQRQKPAKSASAFARSAKDGAPEGVFYNGHACYGASHGEGALNGQTAGD